MSKESEKYRISKRRFIPNSADIINKLIEELESLQVAINGSVKRCISCWRC